MVEWQAIDTVFLDMDGTLLDLHFDTYFWVEHLPQRYAEKHNMTLANAKDYLHGRYRSLLGTINWYCIDYWSEQLGLDVALLKEEVDHLIAVHPHVTDFLDALRQSGRRTVLVTNAHTKSLDLKMQKTQLGGHFDQLISSHSFGMAKEQPGFWQALQQQEPFDPAKTLLVDDSLPVLRSARDYGMKWLLAVYQPDSKDARRDVGEFAAIESFADIMPTT